MNTVNQHGVDLSKIKAGDKITAELIVSEKGIKTVSGGHLGVWTRTIHSDETECQNHICSEFITKHEPKPVEICVGLKFRTEISSYEIISKNNEWSWCLSQDGNYSSLRDNYIKNFINTYGLID